MHDHFERVSIKTEFAYLRDEDCVMLFCAYSSGRLSEIFGMSPGRHVTRVRKEDIHVDPTAQTTKLQ